MSYISLSPITIYGTQTKATSSTLTFLFDHPIVITHIRIEWNAGCEDLLFYSIKVNGQSIFQGSESVFGDGETMELFNMVLSYPVAPNKIEITTNNTDPSYDHKLKFIMELIKPP